MAADAEKPNPAKSGRGGAEIPFSPVVTKLLGESGEPQDLVTLVGYIGPSKKEGHVRLYTGLDFQTYYEIPREGVVLAEAVDRDDENSPTQLTIQANATVDLVQTSKQTGPASYLAGSIAGTYLAGAAAAQMTAVHPIPTKYTICRCWITFPTQCVCTHPPVCPGIPGGQVGEEAAAAYQYRSVNYTCPCFATRWPLCPLPEMQVGPEAAALPPLTSPVICRFTTPIACHWTYFWQCHLTHPPICPIASAGVACPPVSLGCPEGQGGGPVEAQAQAGMYAYPASVFCRSWGLPCPSQGLPCPSRPCPVTQEPVQAAGVYAYPASVFCPSYAIPCLSQWIHCPSRPCPVTQEPVQAAVHPSIPCRTIRDDCTMVAPCTLHHGCPTNYHQLC